jgi:hypothetical protein
MKTLNPKIFIDTDFIVFRGRSIKRVVRFISEPWWYTVTGEERHKHQDSHIRIVKVGDDTVTYIRGVRKIGEWVYENAQNGSALIYQDHKTRSNCSMYTWSHPHLERYYYTEPGFPY